MNKITECQWLARQGFCVCVFVCERVQEWERGSVASSLHLFSIQSCLHFSLTDRVSTHTHTHRIRHKAFSSPRCMLFSCINQQRFWHLTEPYCWFSPWLLALPQVTLSIRPFWKHRHPLCSLMSSSVSLSFLWFVVFFFSYLPLLASFSCSSPPPTHLLLLILHARQHFSLLYTLFLKIPSAFPTQILSSQQLVVPLMEIT